MNEKPYHDQKRQCRHCLICNTELGPHIRGRDSDDVCNDSQCQHLHRQRLTMAPEVYKPHLAFQQKLIRTRKLREQTRQEHIKAVQNREREQNLRIANAMVEHNPELAKNSIEVVMIPTGLSQMIKLDADRIDAYRSHLQQVASEAMDADNAASIPVDQHVLAKERLLQQEAYLSKHPHVRDRSDQLCTLCRGGCCASGANHGFISSITIRRQLDAEPQLSGEQIVQRYLGYLQEESINGACINQTDRGCALPRELRSDVCNVYFCDELKFHQAALETGPAADVPTIVIQRANHNWNRFETPHINPVEKVFLIKEGQLIELEQNTPD